MTRSATSKTSLAEVTAVILAGGLGTRLRSVVADRPKVLAAIQRRPFLVFLLEQLAAAGVRDAVLCTGYLGEQVEDALGESFHGLRLSYSRETSPFGTGGALRLAVPQITADCALVMNGDSYCDADLNAFKSWHDTRGAEASLLLAKVPDTSRFGTVVVDADGRVLRFEEKQQNPGPGWVNAGLYLINRKLLDTIPSNGPCSLEREIFPMWIGKALYGCRSNGQFVDIGTPESYAAAAAFLARL